MNQTITLNENIISDAAKYGKEFSRSTTEQLEHWTKIGKIAEENPDLSYEFIKNILIALEEKSNNEVKKYEFS